MPRGAIALLISVVLGAGCTLLTDFDGIAEPSSDASSGQGGSGGSAGSSGSSASGPSFPRLAVHEASNPKDFDDPAHQALAARTHLSVMGIYPGWDDSHEPVEQVAQNVKQLNPETRLFASFRTERLPDVTSGNAYQEVIDRLTSTSSWLYVSGASGAKVAVPGTTDTFFANATLFTPEDAEGLSFIEWLAHWSVSVWFDPSPSLDGIFIDELGWKAPAAGDWDRDGDTDDPNDAQTSTWYRAGYARYVQDVRALAPERLVLASLNALADPGAAFGELEGLLHGGMVWDLIGRSYSEEESGFDAMLAAYRRALAVTAPPKLVIFHMVGEPDDYRTFRYGLAACLMDDGYFAYNDNDGQFGIEWFDEYDVDLGAATSPPPTAAWSNGVWRRDFEHGIALANPRGNGPQTVDLGGTFRRITGAQDPVVNDGSATSSVTLQERDGLILLR